MSEKPNNKENHDKNGINEHTIFNPFYSEHVKEPIDKDWAAKRRVADAIRNLSEILVTTTSNADTLNSIAETLELQADKMSEAMRIFGRTAFIAGEDGKYGTMSSVGYELNPLDGRSNPVAAPMRVWIDEEKGECYGHANMGWQYEGPPNSLHGGFVAAIFDQFLGVGQKLTGQPGVTGTLSIRYLQLTPLNTDLRLVGRVKSVSGRKNVLEAEMWAGDVLTATCEGLFIHIDLEAYHKILNKKTD